MASDMPTARQTHINEAMCRLEDAAERLEQKLTQLDERLVSVMRGIDCEKAGIAETCDVVPLASHIHSSASRIIRCVDRVQCLLDGIEL